MRGRRFRRLRCAVLTLAVALFVAGGAAHAQESQREPSTDAPPCGWVDPGDARAGYFRDLCRAVGVATAGSGDASATRRLEPGKAAEALGSAEIAIAFALPLTMEAPSRAVFGPVVWIGEDARWAVAHSAGAQRTGDLAAWLFYALVQAEAWRIDAAAVEAGLAGPDGERFLAYEETLTRQLGLPGDALRRMIAAVGHHGEIWSRHFGADPGPNRPAEHGGQLYAPPVGER